MRGATLVIFADRDAWRIGVAARGDDAAAVSIVEAPLATDASPEARAAALAEAITQTGGGTGNVVLALSTHDCLCAPIAMAGVPPGRQRSPAMLYRLEEMLPVSAEDVVADFIVPSTADRALGVCVERRVLGPILAAVDTAGVRVGMICPTSLLGLQHWLDGRSRSAAGDEIVVCSGELFVLDARGGLKTWYLVGDDSRDVAMHVRMASITSANAGDPVDATSVDVRKSAVLAARDMFGGRARPWINFVDGCAGSNSRMAGRGATRWLATAAAVLIACAAAAMFVMAGRFDGLAAMYELRQEELFRRALPGQPLPADVRSRLASEAQANAPRRAGTPMQTGNLVALRDVIAYLPADVRFRVYDVRIDADGGFTLEGEAPTHGDADAVAEALRRRPGFEVEPPRSEQRAGRGGVAGVAFTIVGSTTGDAKQLPRPVPERRASR